MIDVLATILTFVALGAAAGSLVMILLNQALLLGRPLTRVLLGVLAMLELGLLVQAVSGVGNMLFTSRQLDRFAFVGYLVGPLLIVPLAAVWALAERSRWGSGVLVVGCLAVPVMIVRLHQVWTGHV
ncbi:MAG: hypothetical protein ACRDQU_11255 [Pseudonocardiaceae bacterium]